MSTDIVVYEAANCADMGRVWELTYTAYSAAGYCPETPTHSLRHYKILDCQPETTVFCVDQAGVLVGTCSLTLDGPRGLHTDFCFHEETEAVREECHAASLKLAAAWRIATRPQCHESTKVIKALLNKAFDFGVKEAVQVCLFTFNPKHQRIYERLFGLRLLAGPRADGSVEGAPAILMRGDVSTMQASWAAHK